MKRKKKDLIMGEGEKFKSRRINSIFYKEVKKARKTSWSQRKRTEENIWHHVDFQ